MQRRVVTVSAFLISFSLIYILIWKKTPGKWRSYQAMGNPIRISDIFWRPENETKGNLLYATVMPSAYFSSENNSTTSEHRMILSQSELNHQVNITPIPILYKKNFKKMPTWDFEDVYTQSNEEQRLVCSTSLQKSKNESFQKAAMWNIQLWFHNGHLNVKEWNRLAHFNNPFGFMEYNYTDIKKAVDLLQKPTSNQLLPVPSSSKDGCIRCAVVGTSGILHGSRKGNEIDSHDYVFRVNGAVTEGHEVDVGNKTSVYVHTSFSLTQSLQKLKKFGFQHIPQDEGIKYVLIPEGLRDFDWLEVLLQKETVTNKSSTASRISSYYNNRVNKDTFYVLHPDFLRYVRNRFLRSKNLEESYWDICRPTNGAFTLFLALHTCDIVDVYGFITEDHRKYSNYYYDRDTKTRVIFYINHDYELEIKTWKKLHDAGIIHLYQRQEE